MSSRLQDFFQCSANGAGLLENETSAGVAVASKPPYSFRRAFGSKNGGTEATATVFGQQSGEFPIQFVDQWIYVLFPLRIHESSFSLIE